MATDLHHSSAASDPEILTMKERIARRGRWWIVGTLSALALVIWALPTLVAHSPLRNSILRSAADGLRGDIRAGGASFGWFSAVKLYDLEITDEHGDRVLLAPVVACNQSLRKLISDQTDLGGIRVERPQLVIALAEDGSNVEEVFARWLEEENSLSSPGLDLEIVEADVTVQDRKTDEQWKLEQVSAAVTLARDWAEPLVVQGSAVLPQSKGASSVKVEANISRSEADSGLATVGRVVLQGDALPLKLVEAFVRRQAPGLELSGRASANMVCEWAVQPDAEPRALIDGELAAADLLVAGPQLGNDRFALSRLKLPCRITRNGDELTIERLEVDCDVGAGALAGPVTVWLDKPLPVALMTALVRENYHLQGQIDLARLAALLPETLRIREGTEVTAGQLQINLKHQAGDKGAVWDGRAEMTNIAAVNQGRRITWQQPVVVTVAARDAADGPIIERLLWKSSFLELEAAGSMELLNASAVFNLNDLARELEQFVDLRGFELAGDGWSHVTWQRSADGVFKVDGEFQIRDLSLGSPDHQPWTEDSLVVRTSLAGRSQGREIQRVDSGLVELESRSDNASVKLLKPVADLTAASAWSVEIRAQGQLATWLPRLEPWVGPLSDWDLAGSAQLESTVTASDRMVRLDGTTLNLKQFHAAGHGLTINEREMKINGGGSVDLEKGRVEIPQADVATTSLAVRARNMTLNMDDGAIRGARGELTYSADMARLGNWFIDPNHPPARTLSGALQGRMDIVQRERETTARFDAVIDNLAMTDAKGAGWTEPSVELKGDGVYEADERAIRIKNVAIDSGTVQGNASGQISDLADSRDLELTGRLEVDSQKLIELIRPYVGQGVQVVPHRAARPFAVSVSLANPVKTLVARGGVGWTGADVYGLQVGPAEIQGDLRDGLLEIAPMDISVSGGKLTTAPHVRLWPDEPGLTIDEGPLLAQVQVTPDMCEKGLKYILPVLADVASAQGRFSIDMDESVVPLNTPETSDLSGRLTVNAMQIEAGPLLQQIVYVADTLRRLATGKELRTEGAEITPIKLRQASTVPFRMVEGRIYHRDLILDFDDVTVRTYGSVGLDQSLSLMAEMPVPQKWIGKNLLGSALKDNVVRLPVTGSLSRPKIDERAIQQATAQFVRKGAEGAILEGLNRGLRELLPK
jgi:translocation and assembly module TamB